MVCIYFQHLLNLHLLPNLLLFGSEPYHFTELLFQGLLPRATLQEQLLALCPAGNGLGLRTPGSIIPSSRQSLTVLSGKLLSPLLHL